MYKLSINSYVSPVDYNVYYSNDNIIIDDAVVFVKYDENDLINILSISKLSEISNGFKILTENGWETCKITDDSTDEQVSKFEKRSFSDYKLIISNKNNLTDKRKINIAALQASDNKHYTNVVCNIVNSSIENKILFKEKFMYYMDPKKEYSNEVISLLNYIDKCIEYSNKSE